MAEDVVLDFAEKKGVDAATEAANAVKQMEALANKVRTYYDYLWACGHQRDEASLLRSMLKGPSL